jgi:hypothetical protein
LWHDNARLGVIAPTYAGARDICVEGESGLLRAIPPGCIDNRGWYEQVPAQLMRWNRVNGEIMSGLTRRRRPVMEHTGGTKRGGGCIRH